MKKKSDRPMEAYMKAGAEMRLLKALATRLICDLYPVVHASDVDKIRKAMEKIHKVCSDVEDNMFRDYPELSDQYLTVFYGALDGETRNEVDREVKALAKGIADELLTGQREKLERRNQEITWQLSLADETTDGEELTALMREQADILGRLKAMKGKEEYYG